MAESDKKFDVIEAVDIDLASDLPAELSSELPLGQGLAQPNGGNGGRSHGTSTVGKKHLRLPLGYQIAIGCLIISVAGLLWYAHSAKQSDDLAASARHTSAVTDTPANGPFKQQQSAVQRRAAQDPLAGIIELQGELEASHVTQWASEDYSAAIADATSGDQLYQQRDFVGAEQKYQLSKDQLEDIKARIPSLIADSLSAGDQAILAGDIDEANSRFELVALIEPNNEAAVIGLQRTAKIPQVLELMTLAKTQMSEGQAGAALLSFQQAARIDPLYQPANEAVGQAKLQITNNGFQQAMNQGYLALGQSNYSSAVAAFKRALGLEPDSSAATQALTQAQTELKQSRIDKLLVSATNYEQDEQWQNAANAYRAILALDKAVVVARVGDIRTQARADLDLAITIQLANPLRLSTPSVYKHAGQLLADARQIRDAGPRLLKQITQMEESLAFASTPRTVTLLSDKFTTVNLLKVGKLGAFAEKVIELKPGKYIAEGIRKGYRDVRINFTVDGGDAIAPVRVICEETI